MVDPHAPARRGAEGYHRSQDGPSSVAGGRPYPSMKELQDMAAAMNLSEAEDGASVCIPGLYPRSIWHVH
jgi:hypothetical protein